MARNYFVNALRCALIVTLAVATAGCPVPFKSGYSDTSRQNLSADSARQLAIGVSTRQDVLIRLGEPDQSAPDESWFIYGSTYGQGGIVFVLFAGGSAAGAGWEKMEYRRLLVTFDERGLLTNADFRSEECLEGMVGVAQGGARSGPCAGISTQAGKK